MDNVYELVNVEIHEYCALNVESGEKSFSKRKQTIQSHTRIIKMSAAARLPSLEKGTMQIRER